MAEPLPLTYGNFKNNGDGLIPAPDAAPFVWHRSGHGGGSSPYDAYDPQRSGPLLFFAFPFEKLPPADHAPLLNGIVGWLTDVGDSTFVVDQRSGAPGAERAYTLTLRNHPAAPPHHLTLTNTLPLSLTLLPSSLSGGAVYDPPPANSPGKATWPAAQSTPSPTAQKRPKACRRGRAWTTAWR
ncbi:MAG: hypothetical protein M5U34_47825 [Chloroflexi bacterium]|nr:hypothetical protein [Chloroflexota bacterium]